MSPDDLTGGRFFEGAPHSGDACTQPDVGGPPPRYASVALIVRRLTGAAMLLAAYVPLHRLLEPTRAGPAGEATRASAEAAWGVGLYGSLIVLGAALVLTLVVPSH